ncbi:hypothetical protein LF1_35930 [Rubripirellula obstinata]|uniref:Uncharacterized protein n=1 Tax=Rubripirellula obstinata TaxID=406547 RepID=A0A5B1CMN9_9BACT|nr:hypothetical protein LF1_35930 [Rubripirellula obstinata]
MTKQENTLKALSASLIADRGILVPFEGCGKMKVESAIWVDLSST